MGERERAQPRAIRLRVVPTLFIPTSIKPKEFIGFSLSQTYKIFDFKAEEEY